MNEDENILFDRLVDDELALDERRRLLLSLDDQPNGWRRCALAFLEAQSWRADVGQVVRDAAAAPDVSSSASRAALAAYRRPTWRGAIYSLAVAASLLAVFTLGLTWRAGDLPVVDVAPDPGRRVADVAEPTEPAPPPAVRSPRDGLTLWVRDDAGGAQPVHVPLVDAGALDRQFGVEFRSGLPDELREQLRRNGYEVQSKRRYAPLWFENGRSLVVPVEDTRIVPVSQIVY